MFDAIQSDIFDLLETANKIVPNEDALYYGGTFLTGQVGSPEILFLGINPGHGDWATRSRSFHRKPYAPCDCKFIGELEDGAPLARAIVDIVLDGNASRLESCAETSVRSFYSTPDTTILDRQLSHLSRVGLLGQHEGLMTRAVDLMLGQARPRQIVCIGLTTFSFVINRLGVSNSAIQMKSERSASGKSDPVYYKRAVFEGTPIHGVLHLSGGRLSQTMKANLRELFAGKIA